MNKLELITKWERELVSLDQAIDFARQDKMFDIIPKYEKEKRLITLFIDDLKHLNEVERVPPKKIVSVCPLCNGNTYIVEYCSNTECRNYQQM